MITTATIRRPPTEDPKRAPRKAKPPVQEKPKSFKRDRPIEVQTGTQSRDEDPGTTQGSGG